MARLVFECEDQEGHRVFFETSEKEGQELVQGYEASRQWLREHGFALVKARECQPRAKERVRIDGQHCPQCQGAVWDNRPRKQEDPSKTRWPDFACRDKQGCRWAVWPGQYELVRDTS
jgi:hypothetical protein